MSMAISSASCQLYHLGPNLWSYSWTGNTAGLEHPKLFLAGHTGMNNSMCLITTSFVVVANSFVSRDRVDHMGEVVIAFK